VLEFFMLVNPVGLLQNPADWFYFIFFTGQQGTKYKTGYPVDHWIFTAAHRFLTPSGRICTMGVVQHTFPITCNHPP